MPIKAYHKLVRDRIPEIIEADGKTCVFAALSNEDYIALLDQKLNEELAEYQESKSLEELADLLRSYAGCCKSPWLDIGRVRTSTGRQSGKAGRI